MRVALLLAVILALGFLGSTDALCDQDNSETAVCQQLEDAKYIDSYNLTSLKASVYEKILHSSSMKIFSPSMKSLDLSEGEIEVIEPGTFRKMGELLDLRVADNSIAQLKESAIEGLNKLKNFNLRRNNIRQLPPALTKLKSLKNLEISGNPLICNCATLRVRDDLLANAVKISKKVYCMTPPNLKGVSLLELEAEVICMFEEQDKEMQADEPAGSGDTEDELNDEFEALTEVPSSVASRLLTESNNAPVIINDDLIIPVMGTDLPVEATTEESSNSDSSNTSKSSVDGNSPSDADDFIFASENDDLIVEGSGLTEPEEEDGSGDGSGTDGIWAPLDPNDFLQEENNTTTSTSEPPMTSTPSWSDVFWSVFSGDDATTPKSNAEEDASLTDEEFITIKSEESTSQSSIILNRGNIDLGITEEVFVTKKADVQEGAIVPGTNPDSVTKSDKVVEDFSSSTDANEDTNIDDIGEASTRQSKKSMGSYVVLAALLGVLAALVGFAAYKSSLCRKKPNEDPERGTELKTVQKPLLDTNSTTQPKIVSNGNTESAPLVAPEDTWAGPQEMRQWTDTNPPTLDNGAKFTPSVVESDPVKPPRKSLPPQEDTNGFQDVKTHSPMSTFAPRTHGAQPNSVTPPNSPSSVTDLGNRSPPLSPNTQRVKITLQENPDSVPKTPILITRTKPGVNLVKTP